MQSCTFHSDGVRSKWTDVATEINDKYRHNIISHCLKALGDEEEQEGVEYCF